MRLHLKIPSALITASQSLSGPPDAGELQLSDATGAGFGELQRSARQVSLSTSENPLASPCVMHLLNVPQKRESATQFEHDVQRSRWASFPASFNYYVLPFQGKSILVALVNFCLRALCLSRWHPITGVRNKKGFMARLSSLSINRIVVNSKKLVSLLKRYLTTRSVSCSL